MIRRSAFLGGAAAASAALASPARAAFDTPLGGTAALGVVGPFTGDSIALGEQVANGVRAAIAEANRLRGAMDRLFTIRTFDDQNTLASGLVNAQFACDDGAVLCVIGHLSGKITNAALPTYVNSRMPLIVPVSTYDPITQHGYGNLLRLTTKDSTEGNLAGSMVLAAAKPKAAVVLYQDGDYGIDVAAGFQDRMTREKVDSHALIFDWEKPDFAAVAKQALDFKPDVVYLAGTARDMGGILAPLRRGGYAGTFYASQGFFDAATLSKYKAAAEGMVVSTSLPPLKRAPSVYRVRLDYEQRYGAFTPLSAFGYAAAQIAIAAVRRSGALDRIAVSRAFGFGSSFDTVVGKLQFGNTGDPINPNVYFYTVKNGDWAYLKADHPTDFIL